MIISEPVTSADGIPDGCRDCSPPISSKIEEKDGRMDWRRQTCFQFHLFKKQTLEMTPSHAEMEQDAVLAHGGGGSWIYDRFRIKFGT